MCAGSEVCLQTMRTIRVFAEVLQGETTRSSRKNTSGRYMMYVYLSSPYPNTALVWIKLAPNLTTIRPS